jgi:hypothetical protein
MPSTAWPGWGGRTGKLAAGGVGLLHEQQWREDSADFVGQLGMAVDVLRQGWRFAVTAALQELLGEPLDRVAIDTGGIGQDDNLLSGGTRGVTV